MLCYKTVYTMFDLKKFRKDFRLTQKETAFILECGQPNIVAIEKDKRDLTPKQLQTLQEKYGNLELYIVNDENINDDIENINDINDINKGKPDSIEDEIDKWDKLVTKHQETIERLLSIIETEKQEKMKLIETISNLSSLFLEKKAI